MCCRCRSRHVRPMMINFIILCSVCRTIVIVLAQSISFTPYTKHSTCRRVNLYAYVCFINFGHTFVKHVDSVCDVCYVNKCYQSKT